MVLPVFRCIHCLKVRKLAKAQARRPQWLADVWARTRPTREEAAEALVGSVGTLFAVGVLVPLPEPAKAWINISQAIPWKLQRDPFGRCGSICGGHLGEPPAVRLRERMNSTAITAMSQAKASSLPPTARSIEPARIGTP